MWSAAGRPVGTNCLTGSTSAGDPMMPSVSTSTYRDVILPAHEEPRHRHDVTRDVVYQLLSPLQRHRGFQGRCLRRRRHGEYECAVCAYDVFMPVKRNSPVRSFNKTLHSHHRQNSLC